MISLFDLSKESLLLCKYNNSGSKRKKQDSLKEYFEPAEFIRKDPVAFMASLSPAYREVLGINSHLESKFKYNYTAQETKGRMCNIARETVNRAENYFHSLGIGRITNCGFTSNTFKISDWFRKNNIAFGINKLIPAFFSITMLLPKPIVTQGYYKDYIYKNINTNIVAATALERTSFLTPKQENQERRALSNYEKEKNTLKREIPKQSVDMSTVNPQVLLRKISRILNCTEEEAMKIRPESLASILRNHPEILSS